MTEPTESARARTSVLAGAVLWGTAGAAVVLGPEDAAIWQVAAVRLVVGAPLLLGLSALLVGRGRPPRPLGAVVVAAGAMAAFQVTYFAAVGSAGVAVGTAVAIGSAPIAAGILQRVVLRLPAGRRWWSATALAVLGIGLLVGGSADLDDGTRTGVVAGLLAGVSFATFTIASRRVLRGTSSPIDAMGWLLLGAALPLAIVAAVLGVVTGASWVWMVSPRGLASLAWLVLAATAVAYVSFGYGLTSVPPASAATLALAEPVTATVIGVGLLAERLDALEAAGLALVLAGLAVLLAPSMRAVVGGGRPGTAEPDG